MATRRKDEDLEDAIEGDDEFLRDVNDDEQDEALSLADELKQFSGGKVRVTQKPTKGNPGGYMFTALIDEITLDDLFERIRDEYGGGIYKLRVTDSGGHVRFNREVPITEVKKKESAWPQQQNPWQPPQQGNDLAAVLAAISQSQRESQDNMTRMIMQSSKDNMMMLFKMMELQAGKKDEGLSISDALALAKSMVPEKTDDSFTTFLKGLEMGKELGDGGSDNVLQTAIKSFGPAISAVTENAIAQQAHQARQQIPQARRLPPATQQQLPPEYIAPGTLPHENARTEINGDEKSTLQNDAHENGATQATNADEATMLEMLQFRPYIAMLNNAAVQDADIETYANLIFDQIPSEVIEKVVGNDQNYEKLGDYVETFREKRQWFDALRGCLLEFLEQEAHGGPSDGVYGEPGSPDVSSPAVSGAEASDDSNTR